MSQQLIKARTSYALLHVMVAVVLAMFTFVFLQLVVLCTELVRCLDRHWSYLLLVPLDGPVCFKTNQLRSYIPVLRTWELHLWTISFFEKRNGPPPPPAPLSPLSAVPNLEPLMCLYCTDIILIISFLAVWID